MDTDDIAEFDSDKLIDFLKFAFATVDTAGERLGGIGRHSGPHAMPVAIETVIGHLATVSHVLQSVVGVYCPHCADSMNTYTDGRPVTTHLRFLEGSEVVHTWHPDKANPHNRPRDLATLTTRNGTRKRIVVSAPGHIDAVTVTEAAQADDRRP
jgi:hypothetical protein